ncbi:heme lyase CcmF/NrfE family subunit [Raoultibacter timonensis]|uniref:heme lyase CcmF/NrfE family subunit n=1 Tax=Raoultibacter timonensis TaxID=1907662 RepID=UPI000C81ABBB|nr:cytochrome c biogenesis protein CcsA [Raoultibacter timonensis]
MSVLGSTALCVALACGALSTVCLFVGSRLSERRGRIRFALNAGGYGAVFAALLALSFSLLLLAFCFTTGDISLEYVVFYRSDSTSDLAWLYKLSGIWGGREGSLLVWAWLLAAYNSAVAAKSAKAKRSLDGVALSVLSLILTAFISVLVFSEDNSLFAALDPVFVDSAGQLTGLASKWGMSSLLEHWAMAIHPPMLFIGYAGLTVPFAYAIAALVTNDPSSIWVSRCSRIALFSWVFLGLGIGVGAAWAYSVLGWGGYWGWDPVENASLLPWLAGVALIHSFIIFRKRGTFRCWTVLCACIVFSFVSLGAFVTRSGIIGSVHAFDGDPSSFALFLFLSIAPVALGAMGLVLRRKSFSFGNEKGCVAESIFSRDVAFYFNNLITVAFSFLLGYMTLAAAMPSWMPFGGQTVSAETYNAIAAPLGIVYCAVIAVCPLLSWCKTGWRQFLRRARVPGICATVLFAALMAYHVSNLIPSYEAALSGGGAVAEALAARGPSWYYNGLSAVGFLVASLLFFNSIFALRKRSEYGGGCQGGASRAARALAVARERAATYGGFAAHASMALILAGLIGSSMYVTEKIAYLDYDAEKDEVAQGFQIEDYTLEYKGKLVTVESNQTDLFNTVYFDVYEGDKLLATVDPSVQMVATTQQQHYHASIVHQPLEDLFVVYKGVDSGDGWSFALDVRVNPLVSFLWAGFALLVAGSSIAIFGHRGVSLPKTTVR